MASGYSLVITNVCSKVAYLLKDECCLKCWGWLTAPDLALAGNPFGTEKNKDCYSEGGQRGRSEGEKGTRQRQSSMIK